MTTAVKKDAKQFLADASGQQVFWCNDGHILKNVQELADALVAMSDETYAYHANSEKNDFATWVRDVIGDQRLVTDLLRSRDRLEAARKVTQRVALLLKKA